MDTTASSECRHRAKLAWYKDGYHMLLRELEGPTRQGCHYGRLSSERASKITNALAAMMDDGITDFSEPHRRVKGIRCRVRRIAVDLQTPSVWPIRPALANRSV